MLAGRPGEDAKGQKNPATGWRPMRCRHSGSWTASPSMQVCLRRGDPALRLRRPWSWQCRWTGMPSECRRFDQGSTVCVMTVQPSLEGGRPAAMAQLFLVAWPAAGALCDHIHPCRCEAGEAAHYGAAAAWRRCKLAAATAEPRSDCCTVASLCGVTRSCAPLKVPYGAAAALCGRVVD